MVTRESAARGRTESESTARETGESSSRQIEHEASTATRNDSEFTKADMQDMMAEQRKMAQQLIEQQTASNARWEQAQSERGRSLARSSSSLTELPIAPPQPTSTKLFKMKDPVQKSAQDADRNFGTVTVRSFTPRSSQNSSGTKYPLS
jgi:hypothetical protein